MANSVISRFFLCLLGVCSLCSCVSGYYPTLPKQKLTNNELETVLSLALDLSDNLESVQMIASSRLFTDDGKYALKYAIVATKDNSLRVDILPQAGAYTLGLLVANQEGVSYLDSINKEVYFSKEQKYLVNKALGLPLDANEVFAFFTARIPKDLLEQVLKNREAVAGYRDIDGSVVIVWNEWQYYLKLNPKTALLEKALIYDKFSRKLVLEIEYIYNQHVGQSYNFLGEASTKGKSPDSVVPVQLKLNFEKKDLSALITISGAKLNTQISPEKFQLKIPEDYKIYSLGE